MQTRGSPRSRCAGSYLSAHSGRVCCTHVYVLMSRQTGKEATSNPTKQWSSQRMVPPQSCSEVHRAHERGSLPLQAAVLPPAGLAAGS
jgi:hypothetical protein